MKRESYHTINNHLSVVYGKCRQMTLRLKKLEQSEEVVTLLSDLEKTMEKIKSIEAILKEERAGESY